MNRNARVLSLALLAALSFVTRLQAQSWTVDPNASSVTLTGTSFADDGLGPPVSGPPDFQTDTNTGYIVGYSGGAGTHNYGQDVYVVANDGGVSSESGLNWVTIGGALSDTLEIDWRAYAEPEMVGDLPPYLGTARSLLNSNIVAQLTNLFPGETYRIDYEWSYTVDARANHEGVMEDPEDASTTLSFDLGGSGPGAVFLAMAVSDSAVDFESMSGSGMFFLLAGAAPVDLTVDLAATANATVAFPARPPLGLDDRADAGGRGNLKIIATRLIPEPATMLLAAWAMLATACARRLRQ